jgi:hypothetical protein
MIEIKNFESIYQNPNKRLKLNTHMHMHARARAHTHTHTYIEIALMPKAYGLANNKDAAILVTS